MKADLYDLPCWTLELSGFFLFVCASNIERVTFYNAYVIEFKCRDTNELELINVTYLLGV